MVRGADSRETKRRISRYRLAGIRVGNGREAHVFGDIAKGYTYGGELGDGGELEVCGPEGVLAAEGHGGDRSW